MIGYIVVVIISIALIYWNWFSEYSYISSIVKQYPSPKSYPIIGNALFLISNSKQGNQLLDDFSIIITILLRIII